MTIKKKSSRNQMFLLDVESVKPKAASSTDKA